MEKKATFGAGCFWGVEAAFRQLDGVTATRVGYAGGGVEHPTYEQVCSDTTGHAEVVEVTYDPEKVPYEQLLAVFWAEHDPTQVNRQGPDVGAQYRSVDLRPRRRAARRRRGVARRACRRASRRPVVTHGRGRAAVLGGRGLPPAVPREARPRELHAAARRRAPRFRQWASRPAPAVPPFALPLRSEVARFDAESSTLRRRIDFGVTSTHSSSRMNSSACSSESGRGGIRRTSSSALDGAHVRQLLRLRRVDVEILGARVLADDHPLVDLVARAR